MRSFLLVLSACGAIAQAAECQAADETTMLQGVRMEGGMSVRKQKQMKAKTGSAKDLVKKLTHVAHNLDKMSEDDVDQALQEAADAIDTIPPSIEEEIAFLQASVDHAAAAVEACHNEEGANQRASAWEAAEAQSAVVASCEAELATLTADEAEICSDAAIAAAQSECACEEAQVRRADQADLCAAHTAAYEFAYCEYSLLCDTYHQCHEAEMGVYNGVVSDVNAAMEPIIQEYIAAEQSACIMAEIQRGMANPAVGIDFAVIAACENQDTSHLVINYPDLPPAPEDCHESTAGTPVCSLWDRHFPRGDTGRVKCNNNVDMEYVADQAACQKLAIQNGHNYYSFRHNGESDGHKCMSSATCDDHMDDRSNEWYVYSSSSLCGRGIDMCQQIGESLGLTVGGVGYDFTGDFGTKGCYAYSSGTYEGHIYYGLIDGGEVPDSYELDTPASPKYRPSGTMGCA